VSRSRLWWLLRTMFRHRDVLAPSPRARRMKQGDVWASSLCAVPRAGCGGDTDPGPAVHLAVPDTRVSGLSNFTL
jgi:hypothetical protein